MTQGTTGTFAFNGVSLPLQPSTFHWMQRDSYGDDGTGHPIYPAVREFELVWDLISPDDLQDINNIYDTVSNTGTAVFDLPQYGSTEYTFYSYSGCTVEEPKYDTYFERYIQGVHLMIRNIRTN